MIVGRAVNGWMEGWIAAEARDEARRIEILDLILAACGGCPMGWVLERWQAKEGYNTTRSAFWRCVRQVVFGLEISSPEATDWSSHLVWSNLFKLALASMPIT